MIGRIRRTDREWCICNMRSRDNEIFGHSGLRLQFYDWFLTSGEEFSFLWRKRRSNHARRIFVLARYPALASTIVDLLPPTKKLDEVATCLRSISITCSEREHTLHSTPGNAR
ncbi:hypothetical protein BC827DRAFT_896746 [Russula dissimulans]|nr:hypothetical protein BC827DRAFT_896746 [Russula dissimulans]